jgi:hypothetical protein
MIISRVKAGWFMIGGLVLLFGFNASLTDDTAIRMTMLGPIQNLLFFVSIVLMSMGIYFIKSSKPCPACGETVRRTDTECKYCRWDFRIPGRR